MPELVAWRGADSWSRWHISDDGTTTRCGKEIATHPYLPATTVPLNNRPDLIAGICQACIRHPVLRLEA